MRRSTLTKLGVLVFVLTFVSFVIRGFGQFVVGPRTATLVAGPIALLAAGVLLIVAITWMLGRVGIVRIERDSDQ